MITRLCSIRRGILMQDGVVYFNFNHQGSPRGGGRARGAELVDGNGRAAAGAGRLRFTLMLSLEPATLGKEAPGNLSGRRNVQRSAAHQSPASTRLPDADVRHLAHSYRPRLLADALRCASRRTGARAGDVHASRLCFRESHRATRTPHVRLDTHHDGRATAGIDKGRWQAEEI